MNGLSLGLQIDPSGTVMGFAAARRADMCADDREIINIPSNLPGSATHCGKFHSHPSNS